MALLEPSTDPIAVNVLLLPGSSMMTVAATIDPMRACNRVTRRRLFDWHYHTPADGTVRLSNGIGFSGDEPLDPKMSGDLLVVIAGFDPLDHVSPQLLGLLRNLAPRFGAVAGIESGPWLLARAGLLEGRATTTHWEDLEVFADAFPGVELRADRYVIDGDMLSAGGASPAFDLMLHIIRSRYGHRTAMEVASVFIYEEARPATDAQPLVSLGRLAVTEPRVAQAIRLMEQSIDDPMTSAAIARQVGVSVRRLETLFRQSLGESPASYFLKLRLQTARRLVVDTPLAMREVALRTGFSSLSAFSRSFRAHAGLSGTELRRQLRSG